MQRSNHLKAEILQWNCNGFKSQKPEIELLINEHKPALICLQETRTNSANEYSIPGYNILTHHRPSRQGGVAIAVKQGIKYSTIQLNTRLEAIAIKINMPRKMTLCNLYPSPNQSLNKKDIEHITNALPKTIHHCRRFQRSS